MEAEICREAVSLSETTTLARLITAYLEDYDVREFRSEGTARGRVAHLRAFFGDTCQPKKITPTRIHSVPGRKPNCAASVGPTSGPGPAMAAK